MKVIYNHTDSPRSNYSGCLLENAEAVGILQKEVKEKLLDKPQKNEFQSYLENILFPINRRVKMVKSLE